MALEDGRSNSPFSLLANLAANVARFHHLTFCKLQVGEHRSAHPSCCAIKAERSANIQRKPALGVLLKNALRKSRIKIKGKKRSPLRCRRLARLTHSHCPQRKLLVR
jgi:hypothetical protein